jgi:hypothetical protein
VDIRLSSQQTGSTIAGSSTISRLFSIDQLFLGETVTGPGLLLSGVTITAIDVLDRSITVSSPATATSPAPVTFTFTGAPMVVGNTGNISAIQTIGIQLGIDNDTVNVGQPGAGFHLPGQLGLSVQGGSGADLINAQSLESPATLVGGSGDDTISVGADFISSGVQVQTGTGPSELDIIGSPTVDTITVNDFVITANVPLNSQPGVVYLANPNVINLRNPNDINMPGNASVLYVGQSVTGDGLPAGTWIVSINLLNESIVVSNNATPNSNPAPFTFGLGFQKVVVVGVSGTENFTSDGTVPNVVFEGGAGTNNFTLVFPTTSPLFETATTAAGSNIVTGLDTTQLYVGESAAAVSGNSTPLPNLPNGTTITAVTSRGTNGSIVLSSPALFTGQYELVYGVAYTSVIGGTGTNALAVQANAPDDSIDLNQNVSDFPNGLFADNVDGKPAGFALPITISGWDSNSSTAPALIATATGITSVTATGGPGDESLDASDMITPVTLSSGTGGDTLIGGQGGTTFLYSAPSVDTTYTGATGLATYYDNSTYSSAGAAGYSTRAAPFGNTMVYDDPTGDFIFPTTTPLWGFFDETADVSYPLSRSSHIDTLRVDEVRSGLIVTNGTFSLPSPQLLGGLAVGQQVVGSGVAAGTTISAIAGTTVTLSQPVNATNATLAFPGMPLSPDSSRGLIITAISAQGTLPSLPDGELDAAQVTVSLTDYASPYNAQNTQLAATINWGDGTTSAGNLTWNGTSGSTGTYSVSNDHLYITGKVQTITLNASGGTFTLTFNGQTTQVLAYNASAAAVQNALAKLSTIGGNNVLVTGNNGGPWTATFQNSLGDSYLPAITGDGTHLSGSGAGIQITAVSTYTISVTISDGGSRYVTATTTFSGGLQLVNGTIYDYVGADFSLLQGTGVITSFVVRNADSTNLTTTAPGGDAFGDLEVYFWDTFPGDLNVATWDGTWQLSSPINLGFLPTIVMGPYGTVYDLTGGNLYAEEPYQTGWSTVTSGVEGDWQEVGGNCRQILEDSRGFLYVLGFDDALFVGSPGVGNSFSGFVRMPKSVTSMMTLDPSGSGVDVMDQYGQYWQYDGTSWTLLSSPHLAISVNNQPAGQPVNVTAGQNLSVTVSVLDQFNHPVPSLIGSLELASSDAAAGPLPGPIGQSSYTFNYTLVTAGTQVLAVASTDPDIAPVSALFSVSPAPAASFGLDLSTVVAGDAVPVTVIAYDPYGDVATSFSDTIQFSSTDSKAVLPSSYTFTSGTASGDDNGEHTFLVSLYTEGGQALTVNSSSIMGTTSVDVVPAAPDLSQSRASVSASTIQAGSTATVTLTAQDSYGNPEDGLTVTFAVGSGGGQGTFSAVTDNGDGTYAATLTGTIAGNFTIVATIGGQPLTSAAPTVTVQPGATNSLEVVGYPSTTTAGVAHSFRVTVVDAYLNVATGYRGTVHFSTSDPNSAVHLPANYTFSSADAGSRTFNVTLVTASTQSVTATDTVTSSITGSQTGIVVTPAAVTHFRVFGYPSPTVAGTTQAFIVQAKDVYGNVVTGYTGTVKFTSSDSQATLPGAYTFTTADAGVHTFSGTLFTVGTQTISATDTVTSTITGYQSGIVVNSAAASRFGVAAQGVKLATAVPNAEGLPPITSVNAITEAFGSAGRPSAPLDQATATTDDTNTFLPRESATEPFLGLHASLARNRARLYRSAIDRLFDLEDPLKKHAALANSSLA